MEGLLVHLLLYVSHVAEVRFVFLHVDLELKGIPIHSLPSPILSLHLCQLILQSLMTHEPLADGVLSLNLLAFLLQGSLIFLHVELQFVDGIVPLLLT